MKSIYSQRGGILYYKLSIDRPTDRSLIRWNAHPAELKNEHVHGRIHYRDAEEREAGKSRKKKR